MKPLEGRKWDGIEAPKFPHFQKIETEVLKAFIREGILNGEWWFDVKLPGARAAWIQKLEEPWRSLAKAIFSKRIDAVCITANAVHIIEVKKYMLHSGIGQLLTYRRLFIEEYMPEKPVHLWLVAWYYDPDVAKVAKEYGIHTWAAVK